MVQSPRFKQTYIDFVVEEHLPYKISDTGNRLYVQIEKRNMTTMELLNKIMRACNLTRPKIGIAGLKDKHALARQRLCFHRNDVQRMGEKVFFQHLHEITKVLQTGYAKIPLGLHSAITNEFWIRLKYEQKVSEAQKNTLNKKFLSLMQTGFPNYFGEQRFGVTTVNHRIAQDILSGGRKQLGQTEKKFKLQAYSSRLFNNYLEHRLSYQTPLAPLEGDILIDPKQVGYGLYLEPKNIVEIQAPQKDVFFVTAKGSSKALSIDPAELITSISGPLMGYNLLISPKDSAAGKIESGWFKHFELTESHLHLYKPYKLFGLRRSLRVMPRNYSHQRQDNDLLLQFTLPKSAYASVIIDLLIEEKK